MTGAELAKALFEAFATGDADTARALCSPDLKAIQNDGPKMDLDTVLYFAVAVKNAAPDFRYEEAVRSTTDTGFVEEHRVRGTFTKGGEIDLTVCIVGEVEGGKITVLREYFDPAGAAALAAALAF
ncbi:nuclear transport factor 2 family protein [Pontixanthobacter sp. CEM42]|uniref:nuclear transport factor 2 family protein n=1 Tax=Pontixanthobacter sp. CEM42 TaxID=2792077 RepID=UPI001ADF8D29|nr:nuclear transport factor 2 family protein [Pontixanthobacter sp. CEM42]